MAGRGEQARHQRRGLAKRRGPATGVPRTSQPPATGAQPPAPSH
ncbi:hypothetical protein [Crossiella sp. CA198]